MSEDALITRRGSTLFDGLVERFSSLNDYCNPILVKEVRQALKSWMFVSAFLICLLLCWTYTFFAVVMYRDAINYSPVGTTFFRTFYGCLSFAVIVVVPFSTFRSLLTEREEATYEMLSITALSPRRIVIGKLLSAFVQVALLYSAIAPFIAFSSLLQGFDIVQVALSLTFGLFASMFASMIVLAQSAQVKKRAWQSLTSLVVLGMLAWFWGVVGIAGQFAMANLPIAVVTSKEFLFSMLCLFAAATTFFALAYQSTVAALTFESDNRTTGIRVALTVQLLLFWTLIAAAGKFLHVTPNVNDFEVFTTITMVHTAGCVFFFSLRA